MLLLALMGFGQKNMERKISLFENQLEFSIPDELNTMSESVWTLKYHDLPRPEFVVTDKNGEVNLLISLTKQPAAEKQLGAYKDFRIAEMKKRRADVTIMEDGTKEINGKKFSFFTFLTQASDQKIFNIYYFTILNGRVLCFTFNCPEKRKPEWSKKADAIMETVQVK